MPVQPHPVTPADRLLIEKNAAVLLDHRNFVLLDDDAEPLTYQYYRDVKKGAAPKNAPTYIDRSKLVKPGPAREYAKYQCPSCGYIYDEEEEDTRFEELPDNWVCPVCGEVKSEFIKL